MLFLAALLVDGVLAAPMYALVALAFVVVYKSSGVMNFALGEFVAIASRFVAVALHVLGLGLVGAIGVGTAGMTGVAFCFTRLVLRRLAGHPLISLIMVTLGLGAFLRGGAALAFSSVPGSITLPIVREPLVLHGLSISADRLLAAAIAVLSITAVTGFFHGSRMGVALRAIADDQQGAMSVGIDLERHFTIAWVLGGALCVLAGTLWRAVSGSSFGLVLLGLKVFPIVIVGGLDSIPGTIIGAVLIGVLESLVAGYVDPFVGGGFGAAAAALVLVAVLFVRPQGLFGERGVRRV